MSFRDELVNRAQQYADKHGLALGEELGFGVHGIVYLVVSQSQSGAFALKVHYQEEAFFRERDVYLRLEELGISEIRGCRVPQLRDFDDMLLAFHMTVVQRPYLLDFGGAYLDHLPISPTKS